MLPPDQWASAGWIKKEFIADLLRELKLQHVLAATLCFRRGYSARTGDGEEKGLPGTALPVYVCSLYRSTAAFGQLRRTLGFRSGCPRTTTRGIKTVFRLLLPPFRKQRLIAGDSL